MALKMMYSNTCCREVQRRFGCSFEREASETKQLSWRDAHDPLMGNESIRRRLLKSGFRVEGLGFRDRLGLNLTSGAKGRKGLTQCP